MWDYLTMQLPKSFTTVTTFSKILAIVLFVSFPFIGFYLGTKYQAALNDTKDTVNNESLQKTTLVSPTVVQKESGVNPNPVLVKELAVTAQWQDNNIYYSLDKIYLTPEIADVGDYRNNFNNITWIVAHLNIRDRRTAGDRRIVPLVNYLRIRNLKQDLSPIENNLYMSPQENASVFVVFPVSNKWIKPTLIVGLLKQPKTIMLNFDSNQAKSLNGVFLLKQGFLDSYPTQQ